VWSTKQRTRGCTASSPSSSYTCSDSCKPFVTIGTSAVQNLQIQIKRNVAIEFVITQDGKFTDIRKGASSGDTELDRAAWSAIVDSSPFEALPEKFTRSHLALRFRFFCNADDSDLTPPGFRKPGISASISAPGTLEEVPLGSTKPVTVVVTGAGKKLTQAV